MSLANAEDKKYTNDNTTKKTKRPDNVVTRKAATKNGSDNIQNTEDQKTAEEKFNEEASQVEVPTSVAMNQLRQALNGIISSSPLHVECILEVLRSACNAVEKLAAEVATKEMNGYNEQIQTIRQKYTQQ